MMRLGDELWLFPLTLKSKTRGNFGEFALYGTLVAELTLDRIYAVAVPTERHDSQAHFLEPMSACPLAASGDRFREKAKTSINAWFRQQRLRLARDVLGGSSIWLPTVSASSWSNRKDRSKPLRRRRATTS